MPTGRHSQLNEIVEIIHRTKPESVLDIGIGFGKYGYLAREYLELWDGRGKYGDWQRVIDGIEAFEEYVTPLHREVYSHVFVGNALEVVPVLERTYDLALLIDVFEHFTFEEGNRLLDSLMEKAANVLISVPKWLSGQRAAFGNEFETHKFHWKKEHLRARGPHVFIPNEYSLICYLGRGADVVRDRIWHLPRRIATFLPPLKPLMKFIRRRWRW